MKRKGDLTARCIRTRLNRPDGVDGKRMRMDRESLARLLGKPISSCLTCVIIKNVLLFFVFFFCVWTGEGGVQPLVGEHQTAWASWLNMERLCVLTQRWTRGRSRRVLHHFFIWAWTIEKGREHTGKKKKIAKFSYFCLNLYSFVCVCCVILFFVVVSVWWFLICRDRPMEWSITFLFRYSLLPCANSFDVSRRRWAGKTTHTHTHTKDETFSSFCDRFFFLSLVFWFHENFHLGAPSFFVVSLFYYCLFIYLFPTRFGWKCHHQPTTALVFFFFLTALSFSFFLFFYLRVVFLVSLLLFRTLSLP